MSALTVILRQLELAIRLHVAVPQLELVDAYAHASAAVEAATPELDAELLLAIAFVESRFDPTATSRIEAGIRKTGSLRSVTPPAALDRRASLYCGPLQTYARSWSECITLRALRTAYTAGVSELSTWMRDSRVRSDVGRALAGHGCGNFGVTTGRCNGYPGRVLRMQRRISGSYKTS